MTHDNMSGNEMRQRMSWGAGIAIGMGVGVALGAATGNMALGVALGVAIGVLFAVVVGMPRRAKNVPNNEHDGAEEDGDL